MRKIGKKGDEPVLWVVIGLIAFVIVGASTLVYIGEIEENTDLFKEKYAIDLALTKEILESTNYNALVIYPFDMYNTKKGLKNDKLDNEIAVEFDENGVKLSEAGGKKKGFSYFDNDKVRNKNNEFILNKDNFLYFVLLDNEMTIGTSEKTDKPKENFDESGARYKIRKSESSIAILCLECESSEKNFAKNFRSNMDSMYEGSVSYEDIDTLQKLGSILREKYNSGSVIIVRSINKANAKYPAIKYVDQESSKMARFFQKELKNNQLDFELQYDTDVFMLIKSIKEDRSKNELDKRAKDKFVIEFIIDENIIDKDKLFFSSLKEFEDLE